MPPQTKKRKSNEMADVEATVSNDVTTPTGSPAAKRLRITQAQKQALIDNLQLEITERARSLRAHYALQATDLRSRIERRINRIPMSLRKATMGELLDMHALPESKTIAPSSKPLPPSAVTKTKNHPLPPLPQDRSSAAPSPVRSPHRPAKRGSGVLIHETSDKENTQPIHNDSLSNPKNPKRAKTGAGNGPRATSRSVKPGQPSSVLSPKSHNSRTLPRSPIKDNIPSMSPSKTQQSYTRPTSPLKPASPFKNATSAISASLAGMVEQAKRGTANTVAKARTASKEKSTTSSAATKKTRTGAMGPPPAPSAAGSRPPLDRAASQASNHSNASSSSNNTTVITKKSTAKAPTKSAVATKKATSTTSRTATTSRTGTTKATTSAAAAATAKRNAAATTETSATGRRVLRKRG
ncbi:hypothetical protein UCRPC4_g06716 [Phaeomoniella chlamydospora]|uniref:Borealin N-terminal domain-containing protein n=1 Tax=Phaeomoniella chlamydospora TaxID=158046 RepID=A0A0G2FRB0_PHACM|nr:hypothetical protein UCRPC4_g06716 [Phaeomoniella chlamydospora]